MHDMLYWDVHQAKASVWLWLTLPYSWIAPGLAKVLREQAVTPLLNHVHGPEIAEDGGEKQALTSQWKIIPCSITAQ